MADLLPTAEQQELASSVARVLASGQNVLLALAELGWLGIGTDLPLVEQTLVLREFPEPILPSPVIPLGAHDPRRPLSKC